METSHHRGRLIAIGVVAALMLAAAGGIGFWLVGSNFFEAGESTPTAAIPSTAPAQVVVGITIGGVVHNQKGDPVSDVPIALSWRQRAKTVAGIPARTTGKNGRAVTDERGQWNFSGIPADDLDTLELNFTSKDYVPLQVYAPVANQLRDRSAVFTLSNGFTLNGQVVDSTGQPIMGATVTARKWEGDSENPTVRSGKDGRFTLLKVRGGRKSILATARGFAPDVQNILSEAGAKPLKFQLAPGQTLRARVVDPSGKPLSHVMVSVEFWRSTQMLQWNASTDLQGRFEMPNAPTDPVTFTLNKEDYENPRKELKAGPDEQVITLAPLPIFSGMVTDAETHQSITNFRAMPGALWPGWASPIFSFRGVQRFRDGAYTLKASGFGGDVTSWYVRVEADGYVPAISPAPHGGPVTINFALHRGPDVTGRMIDADGKPIANALIFLLVRGSAVNVDGGRMGQDEAAQSKETDSLGKFHFNPQLGPFELWSVTDSGCAELRGDGASAGNLEMTFLPWARLRVRGIPKSGNAGDFYLNARQAADPTQCFNFTNWYYALNSAINGEAVFDRLPATYPEGLTAVQFSMQMDSGNISYGFTTHLTPAGESVIDLNQGTAVTGRVVNSLNDSSHVPEAGVMLYRVPAGAVSDSPPDWLSAAKALPGTSICSAQIDVDGRFNLPGVTPGVYQYSVESYQEPEMCAAGVVTVPSAAPGEKFQMPDIVCSAVQLLKVGDPAPVELGRTLEGKSIHPGDFPGKYIVWITWDGMGYDRDADWSKLSSDVGEDKDVCFVADNVDAIYEGTYGAPWRRPETISQPGWVNGYLSNIDRRLFQSLSYYKQNREVICLIDPSGRIMAMDLAANQVKSALDRVTTGGK